MPNELRRVEPCIHQQIIIMNRQKVVSLLPSGTEIVCALGFEQNLVGRSHECDYQETVKKLPVCSEPKFSTHGASYEIDDRIQAIIQEGLSIYQIHAATLKELNPDIIVTQSHCDVCAVNDQELQRIVQEFLEYHPEIVTLEPLSLASILDDILKIARALSAGQTGRDLNARLQSKMDDIAGRTKTLSVKPTVASIEWLEPLMAGGNWMPDLVTMAGGINSFGESGKESPLLKWESIIREDPDFIFILPCGYSIDRTLSEIDTLFERAGWDDLTAVQKDRVFILDGNQYFNRPGPRIAESLEIIAEILHPDLFQFNHSNTGWIKI